MTRVEVRGERGLNCTCTGRRVRGGRLLLLLLLLGEVVKGREVCGEVEEAGIMIYE